ncbi:MAG TPA: PilT/PilU family type 4a pilus ATPase [Candidatus Brocadiia bacterium]|nr:PilT/PilU family type 4a pilus ATPase [Candidatus Brocadiia bacterium]
MSLEEQKSSEARIDKLFQLMEKKGASDLHLKYGQPPILRIGRVLQALKMDPLTDNQIMKLVNEILSPQQQMILQERGSLDIGHEFAENQRVRLNIYRQRGHISVAARLVKSRIPSFEELNLPPEMAKLGQFHSGLVLVCGPTGCGKSTTLASVIEYINQNQRLHIITIEDPIEFSYTDQKSYIDQREIGLDVATWGDALKYALREDPDVILVGEMRDPDTFQAGVACAETGHLVLGTLHSGSVSQTITRILEMFPPERHAMIRQALAQNLRAIVVQMLMPAAKEGIKVVPAIELLFVTPVARQMIMKGEELKLDDLVRTKSDDGSRSMTQSIAELVQKDMVLRRVALERAPNREQLEMALRGIQVNVGLM